MGLCAGEAGIEMQQGGQKHTGTMATMRLLLLPLSLTLLSVAAEDEEALAMPDTVYRAATFPATTEKVRAIGALRVGSGVLGSRPWTA